MKTKTIFKSLLVAAGLLVGSSAWAGDKTVVKYSFDDAESPSLTAGSRVSFDYDKTSVITDTKFLNAYNNTNGDPGSSTVSLGSTDLSGENWTLSFEWAAAGGCNSKADHTTLKAGDKTLFDLTGNSNWNTTVTITYDGSDGTKTLPVPGCDKKKRFTAATGDLLNTTAYWHHIVVTGSASGVKMTITNSNSGLAVVEDIVLSETNVNPTSLIIEPCCGGAIGIDELLLSYAVEGEVIQTPIAAITAVNGSERTVTATCDTEGAVISYSLDEGANYTDGASVTVGDDCTIWFKATKGGSESDILKFSVEAGTEIKLHAPTINRTSNTSVTITANQSDLLLSPTATIYYSYNGDEGNFTGSKVLEVTADAVITAYATATGYAQSDKSTRAVALWPTAIETIENTTSKTSGWSESAFADTYKEISGRKYAALLLDGTQWGKNIYLQEDGKWGLRASGNWYINDNIAESWMLFPAMKAGDIIVVDITYPASNTVNATYSKYTYGSRQTYEVTADGDVELAFKKIDATTMDYLYGVYTYREVTSVPATIGSDAIATFSSEYAVDFSAEDGVTVYTAKVNDAKTAVVLTAVESKKVPANTGVILKGDAGTYNAAVVASAPALENNQLAVSDGESNVQGAYVLTKSGDKVVFGVWDSETPLTKGRVYLPADVVDVVLSGAKTLNIIFEGETTGINDVSRLNNAEMTSDKVVFNLNGQRIAAPQKGINVINGRKVIVK